MTPSKSRTGGALDPGPQASSRPGRPSVILPTLALGTVLVLAARDVSAVTVWLYPLAWYPLLFLLDAVHARLGGESLLARPWRLATMLWWSSVIWFGFEALNLRLQNWYYVYVPADRWQRWAGSVLAFATVLPAIFLPAAILTRLRVGERLLTRPLRVRRADLVLALALGALMLAAVLIAPAVWYPLAWGTAWLLAEPLLYRVDREHSLFADIEAGRFARIARLMIAGLFAGGCWEALNVLARTRWIYTVPLLEQLKIFEMPPLGFVGFPFFALEAWSLYHLLVRHARWWLVGLATAGIVATLVVMDRRTFASTIPYARDLPGVAVDEAERLERAGLGTAFAIARQGEAGVARAGVAEAERLVAVARLAALRGVGARNAAALAAAGYGSIELLAGANPAAVWQAARRPGAARPTPAEVRVWVRAAQRLTL